MVEEHHLAYQELLLSRVTVCLASSPLALPASQAEQKCKQYATLHLIEE